MQKIIIDSFQTDEVNIRLCSAQDDVALAYLIKNVFREFGIAKPGTVFSDPTTDKLSTYFSVRKSILWIAVRKEKIVGCCGIYPTEGLPESCAELVKFYLSKESRGKGIGTKLMQSCFQSAIDFGYDDLYLESFPEFSQAISMYQKNGFKQLSKPMGNSGHFACSVWMIKHLK